MGQNNSKILVSTDWLADNLHNKNIRILDGTWHLPNSGRDAYDEYCQAHIEGAQFFDISAISDKNSNLPHMVPPAAQFAKQVSELGVSDDSLVVVYDSYGLFSAARVWWLFHHFGKTNVAVLDGGLKKWNAEMRPTQSDPQTVKVGHLTATANPKLICDAGAVLTASQAGNTKILDARAPDRFRGDADEPRAGMRSGHIPNSTNVFFKSLLNENGTFKADAELSAIFKAHGVDLDTPVINSCGSGVTASVVALALEKVGHRNHALYDGSWSEWGALTHYPVETG